MFLSGLYTAFEYPARTRGLPPESAESLLDLNAKAKGLKEYE
jgi:hypothetical protein